MADLTKWTGLGSAIALMDNSAMAARADGYFAPCQSGGADVVIDNSTGLNLYLALDVKLGSAAWPVGGWIEFMLVEALDGTTYDSGSTTVLPGPDNLVATLSTHGNTAALSAQAIQISRAGILIPPARFKLLWRSRAGVTTAATGNSATAYTYSLNQNG